MFAVAKFVIEKIYSHRSSLSKRNKNKTSAGEKIKIAPKIHNNHRASLWCIAYIQGVLERRNGVWRNFCLLAKHHNTHYLILFHTLQYHLLQKQKNTIPF